MQNVGSALLKNSNETLFICTVVVKILDPQAESAGLFAQVQKHLSKLFDNIAKMRFETDGEENPSKTGLVIYSKEEEYVPFNQCWTGKLVFDTSVTYSLL